mmetsp:Transcript_12667/g.24359  ORF Transcript_12667/g.24359 Transcript_12667/m.24359 type:complete len:217 (+) Transcript_12667:229-879(+)
MRHRQEPAELRRGCALRQSHQDQCQLAVLLMAGRLHCRRAQHRSRQAHFSPQQLQPAVGCYLYPCDAARGQVQFGSYFVAQRQPFCRQLVAGGPGRPVPHHLPALPLPCRLLLRPVHGGQNTAVGQLRPRDLQRRHLHVIIAARGDAEVDRQPRLLRHYQRAPSGVRRDVCQLFDVPCQPVLERVRHQRTLLSQGHVHSVHHMRGWQVQTVLRHGH